MEINEYKRDFFIEPDLKKTGLSIYAVRTALLDAIIELKAEISGKILDIGCGVMPYKELLMESNRIESYQGMDLEPNEYHHHVKPDIFWDGKKIPLPDDSVDWVIATEFLEHYFDIEGILLEIRRVLKKNGRLFFTVPFIWPLHEVPHDEYRYTPFSLEKIFLLTGFFEIEIKSLGGFHRSVATMLALWIEHSGIKKIRRRLFKFFFQPFFLKLLKMDFKYKSFTNHQMPSGLYGFAKAKK